MPLFYQHNINDTSKLAVWHITEPENFFLQNVHLQKEIHHPHKRVQHLAGRYLLQLLHPEFPLHLIEIAESNKPMLQDESYHFSISHCGDFAAAVVSENTSAGIDVELITPKVKLIQHKFLSADELKLLPGADQTLLTLCWSCKEAVYKWYGKGGVDFINHIHISNITVKDVRGVIECTFLKNCQKDLYINFHLFENLCLAWVVG
ncbi:4'-phosphopantetheinyl transferase superfamily protein [Ginsengibacter hankyongi]|uniref:4'-phosphopantetheinyl transferase superfamily protein n=1 Tax=Ginsengibacter hankyongi TaxID=2607284 RepID=A0A5J5IKN9_9BACT|nr:4'-phosphopantetheinyl transferase superfamily protein [Ginsengibacter hankyongi]KAA9041128.1 4'-phosphopantetheinyl transferase superfamily protein [Ginsengibacter hankyongi]